MAPSTLLDSDILSSLMKRERRMVARAKGYLAEHSKLSFSIITRYEILRGLKANRAKSRLAKFNRFCVTCEILLITDAVVERAADIYADLYHRGELIGDADILIAASALTYDLMLATNNLAHFRRIADLQIDNWRE